MEPKLSIVATSRNDNHGGDLLKRMQIFLDGLIFQCKQYNLNAELLLVEWNPPIDRPRLYDALDWPNDPSPCQIRIIEVPAVIHNRYKYASGLPLFQMIAKNVGIVRARSDFILSTNIDIIFSNDLMRFLSSNKLRKGNLYRVDRYDVSRDVYKYNTFDELLEACSKHTIQINHKNGITDCVNKHTSFFYPVFPFIGKRLRLIPGWRIIVKLGYKKYVRLIYKFFGQ